MVFGPFFYLFGFGWGVTLDSDRELLLVGLGNDVGCRGSNLSQMCARLIPYLLC